MQKIKQLNRVRFTRSSKSPVQHRQNGAALIITILVILALTILALASTSSNQVQSLMVRNSQLRLEVFNASYSEIDGQVDAINSRNLSDGVPSYILYLIDSLPGPVVSSKKETTAIDYLAPTTTARDKYFTQEIEQQYQGSCLVFGQQLGVGTEKIKCNELKIKSNANLVGAAPESEQHQIYEYRTLAQ